MRRRGGIGDPDCGDRAIPYALACRLRCADTWNDEQQQTSSPADNFNGAAQAQAGRRFTESRGQLDLALRYTLEGLPSSPQLTLDAININNATRREYQGYNNLTYRFYDPGYSILLGVRGTF